MLDDFSGEDAVARLRAASLDAGLPVSARTNAAALADRLQNGVRIVFLGPEGVGKSTLCDVVLKSCDTAAKPGQSRHFHSEATSVDALGVTDNMMTASLETSHLGHAQVLDFSGSVAPDAIQKALEVADIVLWCTQNFEPDEAAAWTSAPDRLKDHSFMVLTKADELAEKGVLKDRIQQLQRIVSEEFHSLFPVTTLHLIASLKAGAPATPEQLAASGVKALVDAVTTSVTEGQIADLDSAWLFLERHGLNLDAPAPISPPATLTEQKQVMPAPFKAAHETIMARAYDLAELSFDEADGDMTQVLELCGNISEDLVSVMQEAASDEPSLSNLADHFQDASDKVMLMTMENDTRSAADAVTILLQLRRDLECATIH